jgi:hypothetical protein
VLEASSDMVHWVALTNTTSGSVQFDDTTKTTMRFYRLRKITQ